MAGEEAVATGIVALIMGMFAFFAFVFVLAWIYLGFAYMAIAKKNGQSSPGLAWIPFVGPMIVSFKAAKMHWWPWILLAGFVVPFVGMVALIVFDVFLIIWHWKMFEAIRKPGWWAILLLIPIVNIIIIGVAAWSKD